MFYPYVTIYATRCYHILSFFFFSGAKNLGICEATKDSRGASSSNKEKKEHLWAAFGRAFELVQTSHGVVMVMQTLNWDTASVRLTSQSPGWFSSHHWTFLRTPGDISIPLCGVKNGCFLFKKGELWTFLLVRPSPSVMMAMKTSILNWTTMFSWTLSGVCAQTYTEREHSVVTRKIESST